MPSSGIIFSGNNVKTLKQNIDLNGQVSILSGTTDPTSSATSAPPGSLYLNTSTGVVYRKRDSGSSTNWSIVSSASGGDIIETSFSIANNQVAAANVTGLSFSNTVVRGAQVFYSVFIDATTDLFESGELMLIQKGASWDIARRTVGDDSLVVFTVTSAGQVQYTSSNYSGFVSGTMKFRSITTSV